MFDALIEWVNKMFFDLCGCVFISYADARTKLKMVIVSFKSGKIVGKIY